MQKLEGDGMTFVHSGGHVIEKELQPGEILKIDTGCIVAFTKEVQYDIQFVGELKIRSSEAKDFSLRSFAARGKYGFKPCPSQDLPAEFCSLALPKKENRAASSVV